MNPASTTRSGAWASMHSASAWSKPARSGWDLVVDDRGGDAVRACELEPAGARPVADHRGDTRAGMPARTMASILLPRPEMRMTMDFMGCWNDEKILAEDRAWARGPAGARPGAWPR